jgi:hypothetical protein
MVLNKVATPEENVYKPSRSLNVATIRWCCINS